tara:strand:+ start:104 stop:451 length:348 start_codon:yes stop_codon:yes gene_type:complete
MTNKHTDEQPDWESEIFEAEGSEECPICGNEYLILTLAPFPQINHKPWLKICRGTTSLVGPKLLPQTGKKEDFYICENCYKHDKELDIPEDAVYNRNMTEELIELLESNWDEQTR